MAQYNLPKTANAFNAWFSYFHKAFNANAKKYGFSAADIKAVNQYYNNWQTSYNAWNSFNSFTQAMNKFQTSEFAMFQGFLNNMMSQISQNKNFNGNIQAWFGPSAPKSITSTTKRSVTKGKKTATKATKSTTTRTIARKVTATKPVISKTVATKTVVTKPIAKKSTTTATKAIATKSTTKVATKSVKPVAKKTVAKKVTTRPVAKTSTVKRTATRATGTKTVATKAKLNTRTIKKTVTSTTNNTPFVWFTSAKNGVNVYVGSTKNGNFSLPTGIKAAYIEYKNGNNGWKKLTQGASFPFVHTTNRNGKISYRACWINNSGKKGTFSRPISYNVTALKAAA